MAGVFNHSINGKHRNEPCIIKMTFGKKFFIWKCFKLYNSCEQIFKDLNRKVAATHKDGLDEKDQFVDIVRYIRKARVYFCTVDVLFMSTDVARLIEEESKLLQQNVDDPNCLNSSAVPYEPIWVKNALTSNKPLQSTISPADGITHAKAGVKSTSVKRAASTAKIQSANNGDSDMRSKIDQMRAIANKVNNAES